MNTLSETRILKSYWDNEHPQPFYESPFPWGEV